MTHLTLCDAGTVSVHEPRYQEATLPLAIAWMHSSRQGQWTHGHESNHEVGEGRQNGTNRETEEIEQYQPNVTTEEAAARTVALTLLKELGRQAVEPLLRHSERFTAVGNVGSTHDKL
jgi:hypothetical protein